MQKETTPKANSVKTLTPINATGVEILLKKQCEHVNCPHSECARKDLKYGGIDI